MTPEHRKVLRVLVDLLYEAGEGPVAFEEISGRTGIPVGELFAEDDDGRTKGLCVDLEKWGAASTSHHGAYVPRDFAMIAENWSREPVKSDPAVVEARKREAEAESAAVDARVAEVLREVSSGAIEVDAAVQGLRKAGLLVDFVPPA